MNDTIPEDIRIFQNIREGGFALVEELYSPSEVASIVGQLHSEDATRPSFKATGDLFAIRRFLKEIPTIKPLIFTAKLIAFIATYLGPDYFVVKSIYFDKPPNSNWFVAWHQDLTISVDKKINLPGFVSWTTKAKQFAVHPPLSVLENIFTIRITSTIPMKKMAHCGSFQALIGTAFNFRPRFRSRNKRFVGFVPEESC